MTNAPSQEAEGVAVNLVPGGHTQVTAAHRQDTPAQLRRRRLASLRLEPMRDGRRDPWSRGDTAVDGSLMSWRRALDHLRSVGLVGLPPAEVHDALTSRGWAA